MADLNSRGPGVAVPPPLFFVVGFVAAWLIGRRIYPLFVVPRRAEIPFAVAGLTVAAVGAAVAAWGLLTFARAHTAIAPIRPASQLVQHGPYRFTRNPMYSGLTVAYIGMALAVNSGWPLLMLPIVIVAVKQFVIGREETYLHREFGVEYDDYRRRVRRWI